MKKIILQSMYLPHAESKYRFDTHKNEKIILLLKTSAYDNLSFYLVNTQIKVFFISRNSF